MPDTIPLPNFIGAHGLTMTTTPAMANPNASGWGPGARHWYCVIDGQDGRRMETHFSQGSGHTEPPHIADVLDCLAADARSVEAWAGMGDTAWLDWADELGMLDPDRGPGQPRPRTADIIREARATWDAIERNVAGLRALLGDDAYTDLIERVEPM